MHSNEMEDINEASAGEIFAIFGLDCATGDTLCDGNYLNGLNLEIITLNKIIIIINYYFIQHFFNHNLN